MPEVDFESTFVVCWGPFGRLVGMICRLSGALKFATNFGTPVVSIFGGSAAESEASRGGEASPRSHAEDFMHRTVSDV